MTCALKTHCKRKVSGSRRKDSRVTEIVQLLTPTTAQRRNGKYVRPSACATDATDDAEATVKTVPYDKRSKSRGAEVSGPVLVLV